MPEFWKRTIKGKATEDSRYEHETEYLSDSASEGEDEQ